jgi:hypothetical protein
LRLAAGENVLYMDKSEEEMLRPRKSTYKIKRVEKTFIGNLNSIGEIYHIIKLKEYKHAF